MAHSQKVLRIDTRQQHGFSLLEAVIVVAITLILAAIAIPSYSALSRTYRIRNDADSLASLINMARMRAASNFARIQVSCTTTTPYTCTLQNWQFGSATPTAENQQTVILSQGVSFATPSGVNIGVGGQTGKPYQGSKTQSISNSIFVNSRGMPIANDGVGTPVTDYAFYLCGPNNTSMAIAVDASGRPTVYSLSGSAWKVATN